MVSTLVRKQKILAQVASVPIVTGPVFMRKFILVLGQRGVILVHWERSTVYELLEGNRRQATK